MGLPAFVLVKVLAPAFFARHDTATPVKVAVVAMVTNAALTVGLMFAFHRAGNAHVGNAIATSVAGWTNALLLLFLLGRRGYFAFDERARRTLPRIILAALGMALLLAGGETLAAPLLRPGSVIGILALAVLVCAGIGAFGALAVLVGAAEWRDLARRLRRQAA
jgi:putative peptidoglycan lipid II flippase